jgi:hypothetical protein
MVSRRLFIAGLAALPWTTAAVAAETGAAQAFLAEVYKRIAQTKKRKVNDFWQAPEGRPSAFTAEVVTLWAKAEKKSEGEIGPIDFDIFANSQDTGPTAPTLLTVDDDGTTAHVRATLRPPKPGKDPSADDVLVFTLKHEPAGWRIDDIHGSVSGDGWNLRGLLTMP